MVGSGRVRLGGGDGVVDGGDGGLKLLQAASVKLAISRQWRGLGMVAVVLLLAGAGAGQPGGVLLYPVGDAGQALGLGGVVGQGLLGLLHLLGVGLAGELVPPDQHTLQLVINLRNLLEDINALLGRYRAIMVASVKVSDVPLLQEAIKQRYEQVLAGEPPSLFL